MDRVLALSARQRDELFSAAAQSSGLSEIVLEKDFWVCWTLRELFAHPRHGEHMLFKGGTSLSKAYRLISRFSEDIDISLDRAWLGFGGDREPEVAVGKERQRRIDQLLAACRETVRRDLLPALRDAFAAKLTSSWNLELDPDDPDGQTLIFVYPSSYGGRGSDYIERAVKIEFGARADHWPSESKLITPYVAEEFPKGFEAAATQVKVLSAERTFWEKATILHAEFHRPPEKGSPARLSRHYYDIDALIRSGVADRADPALLQRVARHKQVFFRSGWASYETAERGGLRLAPQGDRVATLRDDFRKMAEMFFAQPAEFDAILSALKSWETKFNGSV